MLGARQTTDSIICTIDKDLDQIPGQHYNFVRKEKYNVSEDEGNRFFFYQLLVGDPTDGIKGVPGIGPKKATRLLDSTPPDEWLDRIRDLYASEEDLDLNAQCVYIWRKENDNWRNLISNMLHLGQMQDSKPSSSPYLEPVLGGTLLNTKPSI
jgi:5'-3' exonuclease